MLPKGMKTRDNIQSKFIRVFSKCTRMAIMSILASEALFRDNKIIQLQNAALVFLHPDRTVWQQSVLL